MHELEANGFGRVERDDRLLDVFPKETRDKGVELWEKWGEETVEIVRLRVLPDQPKLTRVFQIPRQELERALMKGEQLNLQTYLTPRHGGDLSLVRRGDVSNFPLSLPAIWQEYFRERAG